MHRICSCILKLALAFLVALPLSSQTQPDLTLGAALRNLASRSGVAFVGQVTAITRKGGVVEITLRIDQPLLMSAGTASTTYTLREWAGLWPPGHHRYTLGQRALFFLHAPSAAGLNTPVDGMEGIIPILITSPDAPPLLDIRRLNARLLRAPSDPLPQTEAATITLAEAASVVAHWRNPSLPEPTPHPLPIAFRLPLTTPAIPFQNGAASPLAQGTLLNAR